MSHFNDNSRTDLMVCVETTAGEEAYGWVIESCEHVLVLQVPDNDVDCPGWKVSIPWDQITDLDDITEFMTTGPMWARALRAV